MYICFKIYEMRTLSLLEVVAIAKGLPSIDLPLEDWDNTSKNIKTGSYKNDHYEINAEPFYISLSLTASQGFSLIPATQLESEDFRELHTQIDLEVKEVWCYNELYQLTDIQLEMVKCAIISNISIKY